MKKFLVFGINFYVFMVILGLSPTGTVPLSCWLNNGHCEIREPAVAGTFYPIGSLELKETVDKFLNNAGNKKLTGVKPIALIVPHAGYVYSGGVAAYAYKELEGQNYDVVFIIGPSHHRFFNSACIYEKGKFRTPLGLVDIDEELTKNLINSNRNFEPDREFEEPAMREHSIEVQLPFLQRVLKKFKIVPIKVNNGDIENCKTVANAIFKAAKGKNILIVGSSDLSHYPKYDDAVRMDKAIAEAIESLDARNLDNSDKIWMNKDIVNLNCTLCGDAAVKVVMIASGLLGANKGKILKLANSGDTAEGFKERVVGYTSIVFWTEDKESDLLTKEEGKKLLGLSRDTLVSYISKGEVSRISFKDARLNEKRGVFVTLRKNGNLRGCIGYIEGREPLAEAVKKMTIASSTEDPRFPQVSKKELKDIKIEISVLSKLKRVKNADDIILGKHGVIVKKGFNSGVFLPQVATETGWSKEEFMNHLCEDKAGLPRSSWKDGETEIYTFTAQIFEEH